MVPGFEGRRGWECGKLWRWESSGKAGGPGSVNCVSWKERTVLQRGIMCLGLCKCLSVLLDTGPNLSLSLSPIFKMVIMIPPSRQEAIDLVTVTEKKRSMTIQNNKIAGETGEYVE